MARRPTSGKTRSASGTAGRKTAAVRISHHLKRPFESLLKEARAIRGHVVQRDELEALIANLERVRASASENCPRTWSRAFTLKPTVTARKR